MDSTEIRDGQGASALIRQAVRFYSLPEVRAIAAGARLDTVISEIMESGHYTHTLDELTVGAKLAWRNHARCLGRYTWQSLKVVDARSCNTPAEVAEACWNHLVTSTNDGRLRPVITIFKPCAGGRDQVRIANPQLIRYAGYRKADGGIIGDPLHADLTEKVTRLGWRGREGHFDVLPLIICVNGYQPAMFSVPEHCVVEVPIEHPRFPWFKELGLRWHANPAISNLCLEIGGIRYTAAPFSGWYVSSEIAARNLSDAGRYNMLPVIARYMDLDMRRNSSLWRDRALLELNEAVIYSYKRAEVYMVDHHTASWQFNAHIEREAAAGRAVPADLAWLVPPMSPSTSPLFHRSLGTPDWSIRPNFLKQSDPDVHGF